MITAPNLEEFDWLVHGFGLRDSPPTAGITTAKQIHSDIVLDAGGRRGEVIGESDALISDQPGVVVGVKTADCVPILLVDPSTRIVASIHAGWRGTAQNIVAATIRRLSSLWKTNPGNIQGAIGPSIGKCCYEVGPEVARRFGIDTTAPVHLDLASINEGQLRAAGVTNIWKSGECTFCRADRFFSYRREREQAGRMVSIIGR
jgi:YfiH family protein